MANNFEGNVEGQQPQSAEAANAQLYSAVQDLMGSDMFKNIKESISNAASNAAELLPELNLFGSNGQDPKIPDKEAAFQAENEQRKLEQWKGPDQSPERTASSEGLRESPSKAEPPKDGGQSPAAGQDAQSQKDPNGGDLSKTKFEKGHPPAWQPGNAPVNPKSLEQQNQQPRMDALSAFPTVDFVDSAASSRTAQVG